MGKGNAHTNLFVRLQLQKTRSIRFLGATTLKQIELWDRKECQTIRNTHR